MPKPDDDLVPGAERIGMLANRAEVYRFPVPGGWIYAIEADGNGWSPVLVPLATARVCASGCDSESQK